MIALIKGENIPDTLLKNSNYVRGQDSVTYMEIDPKLLLVSYNNICVEERLILSKANIKISALVMEGIPILVFRFFIDDKIFVTADAIGFKVDKEDEGNMLTILINDATNKILLDMRIVSLSEEIVNYFTKGVMLIENKEERLKRTIKINSKYSTLELEKLAAKSFVINKIN